ncbi:MAG TPA: hypothetical protein VK859_03420, partial [bacterium]|nr:hypothetical protein [bacterium]
MLRSLIVSLALIGVFAPRFSFAQVTPTPTCGTYQNSISFDNSAGFTSNGALVTSASFSFNSTSTNVSNSILILQAQIGDTVNNVAGATYNGVALTNIRQDTSFLNGDGMETWYLDNPSPGNHTLVVTFTGSCSCHLGVMAYDGVNPSNPIGAQAFFSNGEAEAQTITIPTTGNYSYLLSFCDTTPGSPAITLGSGQNQRWFDNDNHDTIGDDMATT